MAVATELGRSESLLVLSGFLITGRLLQRGTARKAQSEARKLTVGTTAVVYDYAKLKMTG